MKKYFAVICCAMVLSIFGAGLVKAGYGCGPNKNSLWMTASAGSNWVEGTLSNYKEDLYKKVYSQSGSSGSWSSLVAPSVHSVTHKNKSSLFDKDYAETKPCWKVKQSDSLSCAW